MIITLLHLLVSVSQRTRFPGSPMRLLNLSGYANVSLMKNKLPTRFTELWNKTSQFCFQLLILFLWPRWGSLSLCRLTLERVPWLLWFLSACTISKLVMCEPFKSLQEAATKKKKVIIRNEREKKAKIYQILYNLQGTVPNAVYVLFQES